MNQSDIEQAKARAVSEAADTACNGWNRLPRIREWCVMTPGFQGILKNLKSIIADHHKLADELAGCERIHISDENLEKRIDDAVHTLLNCWDEWHAFSMEEAQREQTTDAYHAAMYDQVRAVVEGMVCDPDPRKIR